MRQQYGFSLFEILVSFILLAIIFTLGIPSLQTVSINNQVRRVAEEFQAGVMQAKAEAIRNNTTVTFSSSGTGYTIFIPGIGGAPDTTLASRTAETSETKVNVVAPATNITFSSTGRTAQTANTQFDISYPSYSTCAVNGGKIRCLRIAITPAGSIKLCDPAIAATDARSCS